MEISSARLTSLLREVLTPDTLPAAKADQVRTALVKALVQPPAPAVPPMQPAAAALSALSPALAARMQQVSSAEVEHAYRALIESDVDAAPAAAPARRPVADGDNAQRGLAPPQARVDDGGAAKPAAMSWPALLAPAPSAPSRAAAYDAVAKRGEAGSRPGDTVRPERRQMSIGPMSLAAGLLALAIVGFVLLVAR